MQMSETSGSVPVPVGLQKKGSAFANLWRTSHAQAWNDVRMRWRRGLLWILYLGIIIGLAISLMFTILSSKTTLYFLGACLPDGRFSLDPDAYDYWKPSGFFQVTLGFGTLTFAQAKIIDVVWDVVSTAPLHRYDITCHWADME